MSEELLPCPLGLRQALHREVARYGGAYLEYDEADAFAQRMLELFSQHGYTRAQPVKTQE